MVATDPSSIAAFGCCTSMCHCCGCLAEVSRRKAQTPGRGSTAQHTGKQQQNTSPSQTLCRRDEGGPWQAGFHPIGGISTSEVFHARLGAKKPKFWTPSASLSASMLKDVRRVTASYGGQEVCLVLPQPQPQSSDSFLPALILFCPVTNHHAPPSLGGYPVHRVYSPFPTPPPSPAPQLLPHKSTLLQRCSSVPIPSLALD